MAPVIRVDGLWCGYPEHPVLRGVSFEVMPGEFTAILGPNGSGKTTLILALSGINPIERGRVEIMGSSLRDLKTLDRARRMAVVGQNTEVRLPFSCEEIIRMGRYPHRKRWQMETIGDDERVVRAMELTDTGGLAGRLITAVSGGERQRVMMAKALAQETPVLLLDESTSAMDVHRKLETFRILEGLSVRKEATILAVLHDINLAALFCRRLIFLKDGRLVADGPPRSVLTPEVLEEVYQARVLVHEVEGIGRKQVIFLP